MERLDIVNEKDEILYQATREEVYQKLLRHRIAHVLVFNPEGKLALQLRSAQKSFAPLHWSSSAGGHVQAGETYLQAGERELKEELGISTPLQSLSKDYYEDTTHEIGLNKFLGIFTANHSGPFILDPEDVKSVKFFTLQEIKSMIKKEEKFHPELLFILRKHYGIA